MEGSYKFMLQGELGEAAVSTLFYLMYVFGHSNWTETTFDPRQGVYLIICWRLSIIR